MGADINDDGHEDQHEVAGPLAGDNADPKGESDCQVAGPLAGDDNTSSAEVTDLGAGESSAAPTGSHPTSTSTSTSSSSSSPASSSSSAPASGKPTRKGTHGEVVVDNNGKKVQVQ